MCVEKGPRTCVCRICFCVNLFCVPMRRGRLVCLGREELFEVEERCQGEHPFLATKKVCVRWLCVLCAVRVAGRARLCTSAGGRRGARKMAWRIKTSSCALVSRAARAPRTPRRANKTQAGGVGAQGGKKRTAVQKVWA